MPSRSFHQWVTAYWRRKKIVEFARSIGIKSTDEQIILEYQEFSKKKKSNLSKFTQAKKTSPAKTEQEKLPKIQTSNQIVSDNFSNPEDIYKYPKSFELIIRETIKYPDLQEHQKWSEVLDLLWSDEVKTLLNAFKKLYLEIDENEFSNMALDLLNKKSMSSSLKSVVGAAVYNSERLEINQKEKDKLIDQLIKRLKKRWATDEERKASKLKIKSAFPGGKPRSFRTALSDSTRNKVAVIHKEKG